MDCLKVQEAVDLLRRCLEDGEVIPSAHFRAELAKEKATFVDVWTILRNGQIYDPPEQDIKTGEWKYRIEGHAADGQWLVVVFCFKSAEQTFLITVWSIELRRKR